MRISSAMISLLIGVATAAPALADSVAIGSGPHGTVVSNDKPCRVVTRNDKDHGSNSTTVTTGSGGLSGTTTVSPGGGSSVSISPGGSGASVAVGSSAGSGSGPSAAAGSDCVIVRPDHQDGR